VSQANAASITAAPASDHGKLGTVPLHPAEQMRLFGRLRRQLLRNTFRVLLAQSTVRVTSIVLTSLIIWLFVLGLSWSGFQYIASGRQNVPAFGAIISVLFDFLFGALAVMLVFSTGLILYSSLFNSAEAGFLLTTPARADQVFGHKYGGAIGFSSWGFLLLGSPVLLAYGIVYKVNVLFFLLLPLYFVGFVLLPGCAGALVCLLVVNFLPQRRKQVVVALVVVVVAAVALWLYRTSVVLRSQTDNRQLLNELLGGAGLSEGLFLPSHWMTKGLQAAGQGIVFSSPQSKPGALYYLALIWSNGLFAYVLTAWAAARLYRRGYNRLATGGSLRKRYGGAWLDRLLGASVGFLDPQTRLLIVKDFRTFRREPAQWAQIVIFSGLLVLYFTNVRRLVQTQVDWMYQNGLSLLNLATIGLLLCIYTGRFIYPMLSLEGKKFWILGLLPLRRQRLLWGKFVFSAVGSLVIAEGLIVVSDVMLDMPLFTLALHALTVGVLAVGLSGLSVGLGACMPTFQETDPSKIAAGFGGTLNLVAELMLLIGVIVLIALPWHAQVALVKPEPGVSTNDLLSLLGVVPGVAVGALGAWLPMRAGARALARMEF
jgi:ABC-2 type transport system permease protein